MRKLIYIFLHFIQVWERIGQNWLNDTLLRVECFDPEMECCDKVEIVSRNGPLFSVLFVLDDSRLPQMPYTKDYKSLEIKQVSVWKLSLDKSIYYAYNREKFQSQARQSGRASCQVPRGQARLVRFHRKQEERPRRLPTQG